MRTSDWSSDVCSSDLAGPDVDALDPPARIVLRDAVRGQIAVRLDIFEAAVVAAIKLAVGADRQAVGTAAGGGDDLFLPAGPAARDAPLGDLDHDHAAAVHDDRRLGEAQSVGAQFKFGHPILPCPLFWFEYLNSLSSCLT